MIYLLYYKLQITYVTLVVYDTNKTRSPVYLDYTSHDRSCDFTAHMCTWIIHTILTYLKMLIMAVRV